MTTPFLTVANVRLIEREIYKFLNAKASTKDAHILKTVKELAIAEIQEQLNLDVSLLTAIENISDTVDADLFMNNLQTYTIPFKMISEKGLQKLFNKDKKLKLPRLDAVNWQAISYLSWQDAGTRRQYIVLEKDGNYTALRGTTEHPTKGICAICNQHSDVHLFTATVKRNADAFTSYSNYICRDKDKCNAKVSDYNKLENFVARNLM